MVQLPLPMLKVVGVVIRIFVGTSAPATTDFVTNATFDLLPAGTYQAWARDAEGCERLIQDNIVLDVPDPIAATLDVKHRETAPTYKEKLK